MPATWRSLELIAYDFVRLHQPSEFYGVETVRLGAGPAATRAGGMQDISNWRPAGEVLDYFRRVMSDHLLPSGRVHLLCLESEYRGDGLCAGIWAPARKTRNWHSLERRLMRPISAPRSRPAHKRQGYEIAEDASS